MKWINFGSDRASKMRLGFPMVLALCANLLVTGALYVSAQQGEQESLHVEVERRSGFVSASNQAQRDDQAVAFNDTGSQGILVGGIVYTVLLVVAMNFFWTRAITEARDSTRLALGVELERGQREQVDKLTRDLARSNEDLQEFASVASHDLQEPLRKVVSFCGLLEQQYSDQLDDDARTYIGFAVDGSKRMQQLVRDLLEYSRVNQGPEISESADLNQSLETALESLNSTIADTGAEVTHDQLPHVFVPKHQTVQLFRNLVGNALQYRGTQTPKIHIASGESDTQWRVSVSDNGIGIAPKFHERVFGIFKRLHSRDDYSGTGIGLAICTRIVQSQGGTLEVESTGVEGEGSTFTFHLPKVTANDQPEWKPDAAV